MCARPPRCNGPTLIDTRNANAVLSNVVNYSRRIITVPVAVMAQSSMKQQMRVVRRARVDPKPPQVPFAVSYEASRARDDLKMHGNEDDKRAKERSSHGLAIVTEQTVVMGVG